MQTKLGTLEISRERTCPFKTPFQTRPFFSLWLPSVLPPVLGQRGARCSFLCQWAALAPFLPIMGCGGSRVGPQPDEASAKAPPPGKVSAKAPPPSFAALIAAGTVVPDEHDGPYALRSYHANVTGSFRGYKAKAGYDAWFATNKAIMARQRSWAIDVDHRHTDISLGYIGG